MVSALFTLYTYFCGLIRPPRALNLAQADKSALSVSFAPPLVRSKPKLFGSLKISQSLKMASGYTPDQSEANWTI